jgi:hypothetical protein
MARTAGTVVILADFASRRKFFSRFGFPVDGRILVKPAAIVNHSRIP